MRQGRLVRHACLLDSGMGCGWFRSRWHISAGEARGFKILPVSCMRWHHCPS